MMRPRYGGCGFLMRKNGNPLETTRNGTRRRPETRENGRSKIEGAFGCCGHTGGPRLGRLVTLLGGGSVGGGVGGGKGKGFASGNEGDEVLWIGIVAKSKMWNWELSGLSTPSCKTLSSCEIIHT